MNSIKFYQCSLSLVCVLMLMDHLSSARSLISSPYLPHHFIWPKGNNKSLIRYPLTEAAMRKYLITGNKLNFNHSHFLSAILHSTLNPTSKYAQMRFRARHNFMPYFMTNINFGLLEMAQAPVLSNSWVLSAQTHKHTLWGSWEAHLSWTVRVIVGLLLRFTLFQFSADSIKFRVCSSRLSQCF